jgi:multidrug efflux pump subunit AcrA (membrane-fusion protein)
MKKLSLYCVLFSLVSASCHSKTTAEESTEEKEQTITPVTITSVSTEPMTEYIELNATSTFLQSEVVEASSNGYITEVNVQPGKMVSVGQTLFVIKTKEAQTLGNTINLLDSSFRFSGIINVKTGISGYVGEVNHEKGDYVQEGQQLASISAANSFVFILNLPYELRPYVLNKANVELYLPDGKIMMAHIASTMPVVDSASQTQNVVLKVNEKGLPTNLIAKVRVVKTAKTNTISLPKQSVLSDETQTNFWVMKLIDDSTAVKVPVKIGIEMNERIEIVQPVFATEEKFLLTGNYGLPDTAKITIVKE